MDDCDRAARYQRQDLEIALSRRRPFPALLYTGNCHACDGPVPYRERFCGPECADQFERDWNQRRDR